MAAKPAVAGDVFGALGAIMQRQAEGPPMVRLPREAGRVFRLSAAQERLWWLCQSEPLSASYNVPWAWWVRGAVDTAALAAAFEALSERHEILRTSFPARAEQPCAMPGKFGSPLAVVDLSASADPRAEALRRAAAHARQPFEISHGPAARAAFYQTAADEGLLVFTVHQIAFDGGSIRIVARDLADFYRAFHEGREAQLPEVRFEYADYAEWQNRALETGAFESSAEYWAGRMAAPYSPLALPLDRPRPMRPGAAPAGLADFDLSLETTQKLAAFARERQTTVFTAVLAGLNALLARQTGSEDIIVCASLAGRPRPELRPVVGLVANVIPIRVDNSGDPAFDDLALRVKNEVLAGFSHQDFPLEKIVSMLPVEPTPDKAPVTQALVIFRNAPPPEVRVPGSVWQPFEGIDNGEARFDLFFEFTETPAGLHGRLKYRADIFDAATAQLLVANLRRVLETAPGAPALRVSELPCGRIAAAAPPAVAPVPERSTHVPPRDDLDRQLARLWEETLRYSPAGIHDDFFERGGTSLMAARLFARIAQATGQRLRLAALVAAPTIAGIADVLRHGEPGAHTPLVLLDGAELPGPNLFFVPGVGGHVLELRPMAQRMEARFYGFEANELDDATAGAVRIEDVARDYVREMRRVQARGPYRLGGVCFGAFIAFEMARQLTAAGELVDYLVLLDPPPPPRASRTPSGIASAYLQRARELPWKRVVRNIANTARMETRAALYRFTGRVSAAVIERLPRRFVPGVAAAEMKSRADKVTRARALHVYDPQPYSGALLLLQAENNGGVKNLIAREAWRKLAAGAFECRLLQGADHVNFVREPQVDVTADHLRNWLGSCKPA